MRKASVLSVGYLRHFCVFIFESLNGRRHFTEIGSLLPCGSVPIYVDASSFGNDFLLPTYEKDYKERKNLQ